MTLMRRSLIFEAVLLAICLGLVPYATGAAQEPPIQWSDAEPIGPDLPSSWFPELHADQYGNVRLVWESVRDASDPNVDVANGGALMLSEFRAGDWSVPRDIYVKDVLNAARPILASDDAYLYLISRSPRPEGRITIQTLSALYFMRAPLADDATDARSWTTPIRLTSGPSYWAQIQPLGDGRIVVVYNQVVEPDPNLPTETQSGGSKTALFSRISEDYGETWSQPTRISYSDNRVARSSLVVAPNDGTLILAWDEGYDNLSGLGTAAGIFTATSVDGGFSWKPGGQLDETSDDERRVSFASRGSVESNTLVTTDNVTMLVYRATVEDVLLYRISTDEGRTWSEEQQVPDAVPRPFVTPHNFDKLGLAADGDGRIILAFVGQDPDTGSGLSVQVMTYEDGSWSSPAVAAAPKGYPEYPRLAITGGNQVYLAFFVRDQQYVEAGHYVIWATHGTTPANQVKPVPAPITEVDAGNPDTNAATATAAAESEIRLIPYPTVADEPADVSVQGKPESPGKTISQPIFNVLLLTSIGLAACAIAFRIMKKLTGF